MLAGEATLGLAGAGAITLAFDQIGDPLDAPPRPGSDIQAVGYDVPLVPPPEDPPHGKDPRYWLDVSKIIHVPDGQLAPYGYKQIGPAFSTPTRNRHILTTAATGQVSAGRDRHRHQGAGRRWALPLPGALPGGLGARPVRRIPGATAVARTPTADRWTFTPTTWPRANR